MGFVAMTYDFSGEARKLCRLKGPTHDLVGSDCIDCKDIEQSLREAAVAVYEYVEKESETWVPDTCGDPGHDPRWCQHCSSMETGIDLFGQYIGKKAASLREGDKK